MVWDVIKPLKGGYLLSLNLCCYPNLLHYMDITMTIKKIVISLLALICSSIVYAGGIERPVDAQHFPVFDAYVGGSAGADIFQERSDEYDLNTPPALFAEYHNRPAVAPTLGPVVGFDINFIPRFFIVGTEQRQSSLIVKVTILKSKKCKSLV